MPRRRDEEEDSDLDDEPRPRPRRRRRPPPRKKSGNGPMILLIVFGLLFMLLIGAGVGGYFLWKSKGSSGADLVQLQGKWECTFRDPAGRVYMHKVKEITGNTETATWYRADGAVFRVNRVEFELQVRDGKKIFRYFNGTAQNERGGLENFPSGEYLYTLEGDTWTEYPAGEPPIVWTRSP